MPHFCLFDHPSMPLCKASVERRPAATDKFGFRLRYRLEVPESLESHADDVVSAIDAEMGRATKAHGVYQARYEDVRDAYRRLREAAGETPEPVLGQIMRPAALVLAVAIALAMSVTVPFVVLGFLLVTALKRQSVFAAMFEAEVLGWMFDWRPLIRRLIRYSKGRK